jgi:diguanylate cyclase (GGDEF)-like protein
MLSSVGRSFDDFDRITELNNSVASALKNFIAARTAIRDFVISTDEKYYAQVEQYVSVAIEHLAQAESTANQDEARSTTRQLRDSIGKWNLIARQVRDAFASYQETIQIKVLANFGILIQTGSALLQSNAMLANSIVFDVQTASTAIAGYLINGEDRLAENAQDAISLAKKKINQADQNDEYLSATLQSFAASLDTCAEAFGEVVIKRKNAYQLFNDNLAPLGSQIQADAEEFRQRIIEYQRKNEELKKAYRLLEEISLTDPLTGLRNRRFLNQHLEADVALTVRHYENWLRHPNLPPPTGGDVVFLLVDMDHFKSVNDQHGHAAGDQVLVQMRQRLQEVFRESDYLVRWGGEEFLVVARGVNRTDAEVMAERTCAAVRGRDFELGDGLRLAKTCSVGFACFPFLPNNPRLLSWSQVVELADQALYIAKRSGRDGWVGLFSTEQTRPEEVLRRLAQATAEAVRDGELRLKTSLTETIETVCPSIPK